MNRLYIIFPHCYIKATSKELLIYDTIKFSSIYMRNIAVPYKAVNTLNQFGYIDDCDDNKSILQKNRLQRIRIFHTTKQVNALFSQTRITNNDLLK